MMGILLDGRTEFSVSHNESSLLKLVANLAHDGCTVCSRADKALGTDNLFLPCDSIQRSFKFCIVSVASLGIAKKVSYRQLQGHMEEHGFWECLYLDVLLSAVKQMPMQQSFEAFTIPCTVELKADGVPVILTIEKSIGRYFLDTRSGGPEADFEPKDRLILMKKPPRH